MNLFQLGDFDLHSGQKSRFKIVCDALTDDDWDTLAWMAWLKKGPFSKAIGIPAGGLKLASRLNNMFRWPYSDNPTVIVDDVLTTGKSMEEMRKKYPNSIGIVIFARGKCASWITPIFQMWE